VVDIKFQTKIEGPLFDGRGIKQMRTAINGAVTELTQDAESFLMLTLRPGGAYKSLAEGGTSTGHYRRNISTSVKNLIGMVHDNGVIYGPWLEGSSSRNSSRFPGYASFRRAAQDVQKHADETLGKYVKKFVRKMN
jgi:hypothetical protein